LPPEKHHASASRCERAFPAKNTAAKAELSVQFHTEAVRYEWFGPGRRRFPGANQLNYWQAKYESVPDSYISAIFLQNLDDNAEFTIIPREGGCRCDARITHVNWQTQSCRRRDTLQILYRKTAIHAIFKLAQYISLYGHVCHQGGFGRGYSFAKAVTEERA